MTTIRLSKDNEDTLPRAKRQKKSEEGGKPKRKRITTEQLCLLSELFKQTDTPSHDIREKLAKRLNMTNREVQVWFQNRRAKINRIRLEEQQQQNQLLNSRLKFNYYERWQPPSSASSVSSTPPSPSSLVNDYYSNLTPIDILASAAAYVQQWDEEQRRQEQRKQQEEKKHKSWRPWL
ncbi:homeobox-domain-containing protein [Backusella circina FSU 941]|nr:homeobox-domain-containing protein [Backusella circina FSU 941]